MNVVYLPLEDLEQRYTKMMNATITPYCQLTVAPKHDPDTRIPASQFLDITGTCFYKARQLATLTQLFEQGLIKNGTRFLIADIWFPGIEMIRYMAELQGIKVHLFGFNYAGRSDPYDFVQTLKPWSDYYEAAAHASYDAVFVGSAFHGNQVRTFLSRHLPETHIPDILHTGYIWNRDWIRNVYEAPKGHQVIDRTIWPHRPCPEKGVHTFKDLAYSMSDHHFLVTSCAEIKDRTFPMNVTIRDNLSKAEYYKLLSESRNYLSTASQETFGYTLHEAIHFGCHIHVPNRFCYPEMVAPPCLYNRIADIPNRLRNPNSVCPIGHTSRYDGNVAAVMAQVHRSYSPQETSEASDQTLSTS